MSASFIGSKISLISKSEIRYEGVLYTIDTKDSTIALAKVRSFGTEDRPTDKPVAPRNEVYEYIIFRASDIKDLLVEEPASQSHTLSDPAIVEAQSGTGGSNTAFSSSPREYTTTGSTSPAFPRLKDFGSSPGASSAPGVPIPVSSVGKSQTTLSNVFASGGAGVIGGHRNQVGSRGASPGPRTKSPSTSRDDHKNRDRSGGRSDGRGSFNTRRQQPTERSNNSNFRGDRNQNRDHARPIVGGFRGSQQNRTNQRSDWPSRPQQQQGQNQQSRPQRRPPMLDVRKLEEFDFETANAEFEKLTKDVEDLKISGGGDGKKDGEAQDTKEDSEPVETYNKSKSFFDSISCEAIERQKGNVNRIDRRQERKLNQETFGVSGFFPRNWRGGRGGGRGNFNNRGYNNNRSGNFNRNYNQNFHGGQRQGGQGFGGRGGQGFGGRGERNRTVDKAA